MPSRTIKEAVEKGTKGLLADQEYLLYELRDFFSHKVQLYELKNANSEDSDCSAKRCFDEIFKDIPAVKNG